MTEDSMTVWVVIGAVVWEGDTLLNIFRLQADAEAFAEAQRADDEEFYDRIRVVKGSVL